MYYCIIAIDSVMVQVVFCANSATLTINFDISEPDLRGSWRRDGVAVTSGGNLKCKFIFHIPVEYGLKTGIERCLKKAESMGLGSIAFPLLGTGN